MPPNRQTLTLCVRGRTAGPDPHNRRPGSRSRSRQHDDQGVCPDGRPDGLPLGLAAGRQRQPRRGFLQGTRTRLVGGVVPIAYSGIAMLTDYITADQRVVTCSNQDVVYGPGFLPLDKEPFVFQVPEFGDRFWVYALYDARTDEYSEIGKQYGTKPGFYMVVGPDWKGETPAGITAVVRSSTALVVAIPRVFMDDTAEDRKAIQPVLSQINVYPLSQFDGKMKIKDWTKLPHFPAPKATGQGETKWVNPETYFTELPAVMKQVPPLPGEEALYEWIGSVLEAAEKDPEIMQTLKETAVAADSEMIAAIPSVALQRPSRRQRLELAGEQCEVGHRLPQPHRHREVEHVREPPGGDEVRLHGQRQPGPATQWPEQLHHHFPKGQPPPVKGFWSLTLYNEEHFYHDNPLKRYSLGTKNKNLKINADGSLTLYAGAKSPGKDKENNWLPAPDGTFSIYIRAYWPEKAIVDGTWTPPNVEKAK